MLDLIDVSKSFPGRDGAVSALLDLNLSIARGERVTVVGPSGSGKSTLLFTAGALQQPSQGRVLLDGVNLYRLPSGARAALRRKKLGFVFQTFNLVPYLNCEENVALPAILEGLTRKAARAKARALLDRLGLSARLRHRPAELSVGERQRVAIGRAVINEPELLLADEPTGNLDGETAEEVMALFGELHRAGQALLMVTHDRALAERGDRCIVLRDGRMHAPAAEHAA